MNTEYTMSHKEANKIMIICATTQAILDGNTELLECITEQRMDDTGKTKGEYLGGNGQPLWSHCKGHIIENSGYETDALTADDSLERSIMSYSVAEHQTGIEANGVYNVRQLAHWKGGFNGETYAKREAKVIEKRADHGYKIDHRHAVGTSKESRISDKLAKLNAKQQRRTAKKRK